MDRRQALSLLLGGALGGSVGAAPLSAIAAAPKTVKMKSSYTPGQVVIKVSQKRLYYVYARGKAYAYSVATPAKRKDVILGKTKITQKRPNPTWYPTPNMRKKDPKLPYKVGPGKANPLGRYALNLGWRYIRIHGTNKPWSIGSAASAGCYRMKNADVVDLARRVRVGTPVRVIS